jgi:hypothetical protein
MMLRNAHFVGVTDLRALGKTRAEGLVGLSVGRSARFAPDLGAGDRVHTQDQGGVSAAPGKPDREGS